MTDQQDPRDPNVGNEFLTAAVAIIIWVLIVGLLVRGVACVAGI
jgi:hypothetical protein